jgi:hypothetical protein
MQEVYINGESVFTVFNLSCSDDEAIIGQGLFDATDYIDAIKYGMKLSKMGYTDIKIENKPYEE